MNDHLSHHDLDGLVNAVERCGADIAPTYDEYVLLAFAIATDCGEGGRAAFHRLCRFSPKYEAAHADRLYTSALGSGNRGDVHLGSAFWLAKNHGVENVALHSLATHFPHTRAIYNVSQSSGFEKNPDKNGLFGVACNERATFSGGADAPAADSGSQPEDEGETSLYADEETPLSESSEPFQPLPCFPQEFTWPEPLAEILGHAADAHQRDVLLLGMLNVIGCTLAPHVRTLYGKGWIRPVLQTFVVAPPASGKSVMAWCRHFVEPLHERIRSSVEREMKAYHAEKRQYDQLGREKANHEEPVPPPNRMFLIPGDNSSTGIAQNVIDSGGHGLIVETEADTVSAALGTDYGKWSHLLRRFYDHDRISYNRRLNGEYRETVQTLVGLLLSGTPAQVAPLIPSAENGLFSRNVFYYMPAVRTWKDQFGNSGTGIDMRRHMRRHGEEWLHVLDWIGQQGMVELSLSAEQQADFNARFARLFQRVQEGCEMDMASSVIRLASNVLRMLMVIAVLRHVEGGMRDFEPAAGLTTENLKDGIVGSRRLTVRPGDFEAVMQLVEPLFRHATHILSFLQQQTVRNRNASDREALLASLPVEFTRQEWQRGAELLHVPAATSASWLYRLTKQGILLRMPGKGRFRKRGGEAAAPEEDLPI